MLKQKNIRIWFQSGVEIRCGEKFTLLRDEFLKAKEVKREKIYDIFISYGGADTANLNISTLRVLEEVDKRSKNSSSYYKSKFKFR